MRGPWQVFRQEVVAAENLEAEFKAYAGAKHMAARADLWEGRANHWRPRFCPGPPGEWWHFLRQREWLGLWPLAETLKATKELRGILSKSEVTHLLTSFYGECSSSLSQTAKLPPGLHKSQGTHPPITRVSTGTWAAPGGLPSPQLFHSQKVI